MIKIHCVDHNKLQKILKDMEIPDYLHASEETCIQSRNNPWEPDKDEQMAWNRGKNKQKTKNKKLLHLSPCWFNFYAEHILENAGQDKTQAEIKRKIEISITSDMQMTPPI